jgi:hypothetical protein
MNGEVSVLINDLPDAIAVPNDAVRSVREVAAIATMLNIDPDSANAEVKAQQGNRGGGDATKTGSKTGTSPGDVALDPVSQQAQQQEAGGQQGGGRGRAQVSPEECATITAAIDKKPKEKAKLDSLRSQMSAMRVSGGDVSPIRKQMNAIYKAIGVDTTKAGPCSRGRGGASGRGGNAAGGGATGGQAATTGTKGGGKTGSAPQAGAQGQLQPQGDMPAQPQRRKSGLVFVATDTTNRKFAPRVIQLGQGNFDYTEALSGLNEGDKVVMVSALILQAQRQAANDRTKQQMGVPGLNPNANPGGRGPGGGGPGGGGGGGGGAPARGGRGG